MQGGMRVDRGMKDLRRILIIKPSSLGDVATAMPMLVDLKRALPKARIDWLIHPALTDLLRNHEGINRLIPFDRKRLSPWWRSPAAMGLLRGLLETLRGAEYDCVIDAQGLFRSGFLTRVTGAKVRVGFANAREGATLAYTHKVTLPKEPQVAVVRMRALLEPLGVDVSGPAEARMPIQPAAAAAVEGMIGKRARPAVVIPGARWDTKRWSAEGFAEVMVRLQGAGETVVLAGSPDEAALCGRIAEMAKAKGVEVMNLAGRTSLAEMVALLARARLVVGNDSGPLHVAVALGRPAVSVYGPTDPRFVGPYGQLDNVVQHRVDCHPCRRKTCDHHSCMAGVSVEDVWDKARRLAERK